MIIAGHASVIDTRDNRNTDAGQDGEGAAGLPKRPLPVALALDHGSSLEVPVAEAPADADGGCGGEGVDGLLKGDFPASGGW